MKIGVEIDLRVPPRAPKKDGQIAVKVPKDVEERFKILNIKHKHRMNDFMREFTLKLIDQVETNGLPELDEAS